MADERRPIQMAADQILEALKPVTPFTPEHALVKFDEPCRDVSLTRFTGDLPAFAHRDPRAGIDDDTDASV